MTHQAVVESGLRRVRYDDKCSACQRADNEAISRTRREARAFDVDPSIVARLFVKAMLKAGSPGLLAYHSTTRPGRFDRPDKQGWTYQIHDPTDWEHAQSELFIILTDGSKHGWYPCTRKGADGCLNYRAPHFDDRDSAALRALAHLYGVTI